MKVGVCQIRVIEGDIATNLLTIENTIREHLSEELNIICFPELCITGYKFEEIKKNKLDESKVFSELAKKYNVNIFAGISVHESGDYYDAAAIWDRQGNKKIEYRKIHLWGEERKFFKNGEKIVTIQIDDFKVGIMICADLGFAELSKIMALRGCDVILCPAAWSSPNEGLLKLMTRARAAENQMYLITINRANGDNNLCGNSCICDPKGEIIAESFIAEEDYLSVMLDKNEVLEARKAVPWLNMRIPDLYTQK